MSIKSITQKRNLARKVMSELAGRDKAIVVINPDFVRQQIATFDEGSKTYYSIVDVIAILGDSENDPRKYWNDHKKRILKLDPQLSDSIRRLKLTAEDGKERATDVAPLTDCLVITSFLQTPTSVALMRAIFDDWSGQKMSGQTRYRLGNMEKGLELLADTTRQRLEKMGATYFNTEEDN